MLPVPDLARSFCLELSSDLFVPFPCQELGSMQQKFVKLSVGDLSGNFLLVFSWVWKIPAFLKYM